MRCPYCYQDVPRFDEVKDPDGRRTLSCPRPECGGQNIPLLYAQDYDEYPPLACSIIGLSNHGKTVYVAALINELEQLGARWPGFYCTWLDENELREARQKLLDLAEGRLPSATISIFPRPQIIRLAEVPNLGGNHLIVYDTGGETFEDSTLLREAGRYVCYSPGIVWLVSLTDLQSPAQLSDTLAIYRQAMATMGGDPKKQTLVIALTKGDLLLDRPGIPESCREFLENDALNTADDSWSRLERLSADIEQWLGKTGFHNLVNLSRSAFKSVHYCILSAQGQDAAGGELAAAMMPRGVMAPVFWLWRTQSPPVWVEADGARSVYLSLEEAVRRAPDNATVRLEAAEYQLSRPLKLQRSVTLIGQGMDRTVIRSSAKDFALGIGTAGGVAIGKLTVEHVGEQPADVARVMAGQVELVSVRLTGGRGGGGDVSGSGLVLGRTAYGKVRKCELVRNAGDGVTARDAAAFEIHDTLCQNNTRTGVRWLAKTTAVLSRVRALNNRRGVLVEAAPSVKVEECACCDNAENGLELVGVMDGTVSGCVLERNVGSGVCLSGGTAVHLVENRCLNNTKFGIDALGTAAGKAERNQCHGNVTGIQVREQARPELLENACNQNRRSGIAVEGEAGGLVRGNRLEKNAFDGLFVGDTAQPTLDGNVVVGNNRFGVFIAATAKSARLGRKNDVRDNGKGDIEDKRPKTGLFG